jgi:tetratricopeptide (TPR) repeat protein
MNRGHALLLRGDLADLTAALDAYGEAIALLRDVPLAENPSWANSLGAALMNRGHLLHRVHGIAQASAALDSFAEAAFLLRALPDTDAAPWPRRNLAGTLLNRANLLLDLSRHAEAAISAREAVELCRPCERAESIDADLALKSRRALCDALGQLLVARGADQDALAHEASDVVDDALALIRHWAGKGESTFRPLALRFFRYGVQLYRFHQPHFLAEFIEENLSAGDREFRDIALDAIKATLADRPRHGDYLTVGDPGTERRLRAWRELDSLKQRLTI